MKRVLIFASGSGSNFQAIVEHFKGQDVTFELLVDKEDCFAKKRAKNLNVACHFVPFKETQRQLEELGKYDLYVLAGYMRVLPSSVLNLGTFINIHPSLLPKYKGLNGIKQAYDAKECECGVSVHYVVEAVDAGEIIEQQKVEIPSSISLEELERNVHRVEHQMYPRVIKKILDEG